MNKYAGIILAAGQGARCSALKQFAALSGKKLVYEYPLQAMLSANIFEQIIIVVPANRLEVMSGLYEGMAVEVCAGGDTRMDSLWNGFACTGEDVTHVIFHDAVRPWIKATHFNRIKMLMELNDHPVAVVKKEVDSIMTLGEGKWTYGSREVTRRLQTPNGFNISILSDTIQCIFKSRKQNVPCPDTAIGAYIHFGDGRFNHCCLEDFNGKITTPSDLEFARSYFANTI